MTYKSTLFVPYCAISGRKWLFNGIDLLSTVIRYLLMDSDVSLPEHLLEGGSGHGCTGIGTADKCIVCAIDKPEPLTHMLRGINTFLDQCSAIGRTDLVEYVRSNPSTSPVVHKSCKLDVYNKSVKAARQSSALDMQYPRKRTRSSIIPFDFKSLCFYCGKATSDSKRDEWHCVETMEMRNTILESALSRQGDAWGLEIKGRLEYATDLVAAEARYHFECHRNFTTGRQHTPHKVRRGRPAMAVGQTVFLELCDELLVNGENEFFTLRDLHARMTEIARDRYGAQEDDVYGINHLRNKLKETFPDSIYFASRAGRTDVIGFRGLCDLILSDQYFLSRTVGDFTEAEQIVTKAATLIMAEIRETEYDRAFYPTPDDIKGDGLRYIPPLLQKLLQRLVNSPLKRTSLGQSIVQAAKPNGCIMPILFGLGVDIDKLGHRSLQDEVARLGFCMSYAETRRFKFSVMSNAAHQSSANTVTGQSVPFTQYVADNFDHNVRTLDGLGTFHGMGLISATVLRDGSFGLPEGRIRRCSVLPVSDAISDKGVPLLQFKRLSDAQLEDYILHPFRELQKPYVEPDILNLRNVWQVGILTDMQKQRSNWPGYMQSVCDGEHPGACHVEFLSLVDKNPGDYDCIYSTLMYVSDQAKALRLPSVCITFDQPLYMKALDVVFKAQLDIVVRLGGFHTMMSYMGSIGHIMRGSGIEDILLLLFGENTIEHILSGKAYAKAIRSHLLIQAALKQLLLQYLCNTNAGDNCSTQTVSIDDDNGQLSLAQSHVSTLESVYEGMSSCGYVADSACDSLGIFNQQLERVKCMLQNQCRTARLWILYIDLVDVLCKFLIGERTGNWLLHLHALQNMLPLFSVTGHANYARSARIYLQEMHMLPETQPWLYDQFMQGNHVIRRSDRFWGGLSPDLCIEQTMMCSGKSQGGLTHGRGMTETVRTTWLSTLTECSSIHAAMVSLTDVEKRTVEHVEVSDARIKRDRADLDKVVEFLHTYSPFRFSDNSRLISLATGVSASSGDGVNCDLAFDLGFIAQQRWDGKRFGEVKVIKADKAKTLTSVTNKSSGFCAPVNIDPHSLFHRLILIAEREQSMKACFSYELTPCPMSLFKDALMGKPDKPSLFKHVVKDLCDEILPSSVQYVIDGGYLLHKVRWNSPTDMRTILALFLGYVCRFGEDAVVVFDGYDCGPSIKDQEHLRRSASCRAVAPCRSLTEDTTRIGQQDPFLANVQNKTAFIKLLTGSLTSAGIHVVQAAGDADTEIVSVAVQLASNAGRSVAVVAQDTDILALLLFHRQSSMGEVFFCSDMGHGYGRKNATSKYVKISTVQNALGMMVCTRILAIHAFGGCDSTSAIFGHGKGSILKLLDKSSILRDLCITFQSASASVDNVKAAGIRLFAVLYGGKADESLAELRYSCYCAMTLSAKFRPESLPPSDSAAAMHALRVHYQCVFWSTLGQTTLCPTDWGWTVQSGLMTPILLEGDIAPNSLLRVIKCSCTTNCTRASCSCRKYGLHCLSACKPCRGTSCANRGTETCDVDLMDSDKVIDDDEIYFFDEEVV